MAVPHPEAVALVPVPSSGVSLGALRPLVEEEDEDDSLVEAEKAAAVKPASSLKGLRSGMREARRFLDLALPAKPPAELLEEEEATLTRRVSEDCDPCG